MESVIETDYLWNVLVSDCVLTVTNYTRYLQIGNKQIKMCSGSAVLSDGRTKERTDRQMLWNRQKLNPKGLLMRDNAAGGCEWRVKEEVDYRNPLASKKNGWKNSGFVLVTSKTYLAIFIIVQHSIFSYSNLQESFLLLLDVLTTVWPPALATSWPVLTSWPAFAGRQRWQLL